jgi:Spy/CpxP family protein refolding chaperone
MRLNLTASAGCPSCKNENTRSKKMKNITAIMVALFLIVLAVEISAQPFGGKRGFRGGDGCRIEKLNLTDDQKAKINDLREKHMQQTGDLHDQLDKLRIDKRAMFRGEKLNRNEVLNIEKKMSQLREQIALSNAEHKLDIYELLTDDQKEQFLKDAPRGMRGERGGAMFRGNRRFCK